MKKKVVLLLTMVALLTCVFAISVSAASEIPQFTEVIDISSVIDTTNLEDKLQSDNSSRVLLRDADGNYATYLSKYITVFPGNKSMCRFSVNFDALIKATGKTYDMTSIVCMEVPKGVLGLNDYANIKSWTSLEYIKLPTSLEFIVKEFFKQHPSLKVVDCSQSCVTTLDTSLFAECKALEVVRFPKGLNSMGNVALHNVPTLERVYFPDTFTKTGSLINGKTQNFAIFYTGGTDDDSVRTLFRSMMPISFAPKVVVEVWDPAKSDDYYVSKAKALDLTDDGYIPDGKTQYSNNAVLVVYKYSKCEAFNYGVHNKTETVSYANGYNNVGVQATICTNEGCTYAKTVELPSLFTCLGYSMSQGVNGGIVLGFRANSQAIKDYTELTGKAVSYGVFAASYEKLGNDIAVNNDGTTANCVIGADVSTRGNSAFDIKVIGIETEEQREAKIVIGAYVILGSGEEATVSYIQETKPTGENSYSYITYNSVASKQ
ncbi:MAG: leucine-rich repeat protein [Clostridia bacterium]|nr:leucine-rich repeat protein [Clostridia bacterium]